MSEIQLFDHEDFGQLRVMINNDGEPMWRLLDVCRVLEIKNSRHVAARLHMSDVVTNDVWSEEKGRNYKATWITESGLWDTVLDSRKPQARSFRRWITSEVIPSIRKTGSYIMPGVATPKTFAEALELAAEQARAIEEMAPRAELMELFQDVREGLSIADVGALFGYKAFQFHEMSRIMGATCHDRNGRVRASQFWLDKGWLRSRRNGDRGTPAVTPEGLAEFERRFGRQVVGSARPALEA